MQQSDHEFNKHDRLNNNLVNLTFADAGTRMVNAIRYTEHDHMRFQTPGYEKSILRFVHRMVVEDGKQEKDSRRMRNNYFSTKINSMV